MPRNPNVDVFERDALRDGGYTYTSEATLSSRLATRRSRDLILKVAPLGGRSVVDVGCGDGYFTLGICAAGTPRAMVGVDGAPSAIAAARARGGPAHLEFAVADVHRLPFRDDAFDVALVQSVLHHDDHPAAIVAEAFRVAPTVVIHEPNGNNLGLKIIERVSRYHREHGEKSYRPSLLARWVRAAGGEVVTIRFAGFVPMFCSDPVARLMKRLEPIVEAVPLVRSQACAVDVILARRRAG